jgi:hypothetical protein
MSKNPDFKSFNPDEKCWALVGYYMQRFAWMESALNDALSHALGLKKLQGLVVCANITLRDKVHIVRASLRLEPALKHSDREHFDRLLKKVADVLNERNTIAHCPFFPNKKKNGVMWMDIRAKGELKVPGMDWPESRFHESIKVINGYTEELKKLKSAIGRGRLVEALLTTQHPPGGLGLLGIGGVSALGANFGGSAPTKPAKSPKG